MNRSSPSRSRRPLRSSALAAALLLAAANLPAQDPDHLDHGIGDSIRFGRIHPVYDIESGGQYSLGASGGLAMRRPPIPGPSARGARLSLVGAYGITGSRELAFTFDAPGMHRDWRFFGTLRSQRMLRTPYLGPDNQTVVDDSLKQEHGPTYYRHALLRSTAYGAVQRRLAGSLWLHVAGQHRRYRTSALEQTPTLYERDVASGALPVDTARYRGTEGRIGLVWDTRDDWITPRRGVMVEALVGVGSLDGDAPAGSFSYQRYLWAAREFIPLDAAGRTVLGLRQRVALSSDTLPFFLAYEQLTTWGLSDGVVGKRSIRLHSGSTVLASNVAYGSIDLRHILIPPDWQERERRLWVLGFADFGVVWEPRQDPGDRRWQWTVGTGARFQRGRSFLTGIDLGMTNEGFGLALTSSFAF